jgi:serine protease Do
MSLFVARRLGLIAVVVIAAGACSPQSSVAAAQGQGQEDSQPAPVAIPAQAPSSPQPVGTLNGRLLPDFATLVEQVGPAVVNVSVTEKVQRHARQSGGEDADDPVQEFFRRFGMPQAPQGRGYDPQPRQGEGSGFIVSADGYILTNAHVVADADEVVVRTTDRREYAAKVIGLDRRTDVAVLKIEGKQLPVVRLGDPSKLRAGEWVLAIGSPFTFENSVTAGIVSATGRAMPGEDLVPFIQTDVAVNPGNSGGPLFNLNGEVVGINSQIYSRSGGYMGLSFAIPIDVANNVRQQIVDNGKVTRGRIGVQIQDVDAGMADAFNLDRPRGALVGDVIDDGPRRRARENPAT